MGRSSGAGGPGHPQNIRHLWAESQPSLGTCLTLKLLKGLTEKDGCAPLVPQPLGTCACVSVAVTLAVPAHACHPSTLCMAGSAVEGLCWGLTCFLEAEASGILCTKPGVSGRQSRSPGSWEQEKQGFGHEPGGSQSSQGLAQPHVTWSDLSLPICLPGTGTEKPSSKEQWSAAGRLSGQLVLGTWQSRHPSLDEEVCLNCKKGEEGWVARA